MYYICEEKNGKYGVKDTKDDVVEYYTYEQLTKIVKETNIAVVGYLGFGCVPTFSTKDEFKSAFFDGRMPKLANAITNLHTVIVRYVRIKNNHDGTVFKTKYEEIYTRCYGQNQFTYQSMGKYKFLDLDEVVCNLDYARRQRECSIEVKVSEVV